MPPAPILPELIVAVIVDPGINPAVVVIPVMVAVHGPLPEILPTVPVALTIPLTTAPNSKFLSSTDIVLELIVVVVPLTVKLPPTTMLPGTSNPACVNVNTMLNGFCCVPLAPPTPVLKIIFPAPCVPVPWPASMIVSVPVMLVPTAAPDLKVATPPAPLVCPSPPLNIAVPPAPLVAPPRPPDTVTVLPDAVEATSPAVTVRLLDVCVLIVVAVADAPNVAVALFNNSDCVAVAPLTIVLKTRLKSSLVAVTSVVTASILAPISLLLLVVSTAKSKPTPIPLAGVPDVVCLMITG